MKKVIWSLFDSETAITQELNSDEYIVYSIGLPSSSAITDNFIKMDLSKRSCLRKLEKLPNPDIIFASPPCESWVDVNIGNVRFYKRNYNEHNLYWQRNFKPNKFTELFEKRKLRQDHKPGMKVIVSESMANRKEGVKYLSDYSERSAVPIELYHHILNLYEGKGQLTLFN